MGLCSHLSYHLWSNMFRYPTGAVTNSIQRLRLRIQKGLSARFLPSCFKLLVDHIRIELMTSSLQGMRSPN